MTLYSQTSQNANNISQYNRTMTKIVFMGSPDFALPLLRALADTYGVVGVVTQPDRASGRGRDLKAPPVKLLAQELGMPVMQPEKLKESDAMEQLHVWKPDLIVVAAFGQILDVSMFMHLCYHVGEALHRSMLPYCMEMKRRA